MNKFTNIIIGIVVLALVIVGYFSFVKNGEAPVGALAGPDIPSQYLRVGGVVHEYRKMRPTTATTTPCAFQSPAATSSLLHTSFTVTNATGTATTWTVARAATPTATTTVINSFSLGSGLQGTMMTGVASTTLDGAGIIPPNQYIVWGVAGLNAGQVAIYDPGGTCQAEFIVTGA